MPIDTTFAPQTMISLPQAFGYSFSAVGKITSTFSKFPLTAAYIVEIDSFPSIALKSCSLSYGERDG